MERDDKLEMIPIYIMGKEYKVPVGLTIMKALEYAGYQLTRGCGCRGGVCGACVTICTPDCFGKLCGQDNGCGDPCDGPCLGDFQFCQDGQCTCTHLQCGSACCDEGQDCVAGSCT